MDDKLKERVKLVLEALTGLENIANNAKVLNDCPNCGKGRYDLACNQHADLFVGWIPGLYPFSDLDSATLIKELWENNQALKEALEDKPSRIE